MGCVLLVHEKIQLKNSFDLVDATIPQTSVIFMQVIFAGKVLKDDSMLLKEILASVSSLILLQDHRVSRICWHLCLVQLAFRPQKM